MSGSVSISLNHNSYNPFYQISSKMKIIVFVLKLESTQFPQRCLGVECMNFSDS
jgi:hypothetical protein